MEHPTEVVGRSPSLDSLACLLTSRGCSARHIPYGRAATATLVEVLSGPAVAAALDGDLRCQDADTATLRSRRRSPSTASRTVFTLPRRQGSGFSRRRQIATSPSV